MKIAILGTKGIPNNYGGYEQFAEYCSRLLVERGHEVTVYNPSFHPYRESKLGQVAIIRKFSPEKWMGGAANFIYDYLCLRDALRRDFDVIYEAGYHSVAVSLKILGVKKLRKPVVVTNMDGLEYKRSKWSRFTQGLIRVLEKIAVKESPYMISDNLGIQEYYRKNFARDSFFIPYGADPVEQMDPDYLLKRELTPGNYHMLVARLEPENNIETALNGYLASGVKEPFLVVGNHKTSYGEKLKNKYAGTMIRFTGGIYNKPELDAVRHYAATYFHGHSVGGTNPSLLEAMACGAFIVAHDNPFNRSVLGEAALYFGNAGDVERIVRGAATLRSTHLDSFRASNYKKIREQYNWDRIVTEHEQLFEKLVRSQP